MNRKIFIPAIIVAVILPMTAFVGFTSFSSDVTMADDDQIVTHIQGLSAMMTDSEHAESAELILLGNVQSVKIVEEYPHDNARYKWVMQYIEVQPTDILKGTPILNDKGNILLKVPGGETANTETVYEYLTLSENDHVFMYLGMNAGETSYIPSGGIYTTYVIREGLAKDYHDNLVDLDILVQKHKDIIKGLP